MADSPLPGVPPGYHSITPYLLAPAAAALLDFYVAAFGGVIVERVAGADGQVTHGEVRIGDSVVMIGQPGDPSTIQSVNLYHYVPDVDAAYAKALAVGARSDREPQDQFYGDRSAAVFDPAGHRWWLATQKEVLTAAEIQRRAAARE